MAAVRGRLRVCRVTVCPGFQPAYSCHPSYGNRKEQLHPGRRTAMPKPTPNPPEFTTTSESSAHLKPSILKNSPPHTPSKMYAIVADMDTESLLANPWHRQASWPVISRPSGWAAAQHAVGYSTGGDAGRSGGESGSGQPRSARLNAEFLWRGGLSNHRSVPLECAAVPTILGRLRHPAGASSLATGIGVACNCAHQLPSTVPAVSCP